MSKLQNGATHSASRCSAARDVMQLFSYAASSTAQQSAELKNHEGWSWRRRCKDDEGAAHNPCISTDEKSGRQQSKIMEIVSLELRFSSWKDLELTRLAEDSGRCNGKRFTVKHGNDDEETMTDGKFETLHIYLVGFSRLAHCWFLPALLLLFFFRLVSPSFARLL